MIEVVKYPPQELWKELGQRPVAKSSKEIKKRVKKILKEVKTKGDEAIINLTKEIDGVEISSFLVSEKEFELAEKLTSQELKNAIHQAKENIEQFHLSQKENLQVVETQAGIKCWRKSVPINSVGLYIPGGNAPLFSSVLMLAIPAKIAGCQEIILCSPPVDWKNFSSENIFSVHPYIIYTAAVCGIKKIFSVGGAMAVGAMAFGTEAIPKVFKIFGPGNQYVTIAKQMVQTKNTAIDMPAGPSEVLVIADETANAQFVAFDLLSQAEHGADSQCILVTTDEKLIGQVNDSVKTEMQKLERKSIIEQSLKKCKIILVKDIFTAIKFSNRYAPEHLILAINDYENMLNKIENAGSVFLGNFSPEAAGDYASGTNHTLPTNGYAAMYSGVSVDSFVKKITFQELSKDGLEKISTTVQTMATAEGLTAHAKAIGVRIK